MTFMIAYFDIILGGDLLSGLFDKENCDGVGATLIYMAVYLMIIIFMGKIIFQISLSERAYVILKHSFLFFSACGVSLSDFFLF